jgi:hypothetical protein
VRVGQRLKVFARDRIRLRFDFLSDDFLSIFFFAKDDVVFLKENILNRIVIFRIRTRSRFWRRGQCIARRFSARHFSNRSLFDRRFVNDFGFRVERRRIDHFKRFVDDIFVDFDAKQVFDEVFPGIVGPGCQRRFGHGAFTVRGRATSGNPVGGAQKLRFRTRIVDSTAVSVSPLPGPNTALATAHFGTDRS